MSDSAQATEVTPDDAPDLGFECHDCGEVFAPGVSTAPCVGQGHYVGPILDCPV